MALSLIALVMLVAACGASDPEVEVSSAPTDTPTEVPAETAMAADTVVLTWSETGGCAQAGPNCFRYVVTADGGVTSYSEGSSKPEVTGSIDISLVNAWITVVNDTDVEAMVASLPPGELTAAFDGVDYTLEVPFADIALSSVDVEFDRGEWFFTSADSVVIAAVGAAQPEVEYR